MSRTVFVVVAVLVATPAWSVLRHAVTLLHELGHTAVALVVGARPRRFRLNRDTSGLTEWSDDRAIGVVGVIGYKMRSACIVAAGYPAPVGAGLVAASAAGTGWGWMVLAGVAVCTTLVLVLVRGWWTVLVVSITAGVLGAAAYRGGAAVEVALGAIAGLGCVGGARAAVELLMARPRRRDGSDAGQLASLLLLPAGVWAAGFVAFAGLCTFVAGRTLFV
jgi:hypothetical protein